MYGKHSNIKYTVVTIPSLSKIVTVAIEFPSRTPESDELRYTMKV